MVVFNPPPTLCLTDLQVTQLSGFATANLDLCPPLLLILQLLCASKADQTVLAYLVVITQFVSWQQVLSCTEGALEGPTTVVLFLAQEYSQAKWKMEGARATLEWYLDLHGCDANLARVVIAMAIAQGAQQQAPPA
uniref:Uncharacterized protein n=1 Tax=Plectus sambesii TaxID=2011161 RepID=A0A914UT93_9BILA